MKKAITLAAMATVLAFALAGCGGSSQPSASSAAASSAATSSVASSSAAASSAATSNASFDGSAFADTGAGTMILRTPGGTTENGNIPQIALDSKTISTQISLEYIDGDGSVCTVYVDGVENAKKNAAQNSQSTIDLKDDAISAGVHTVEMVAMDGDTPTIYKKAQYEIVK